MHNAFGMWAMHVAEIAAGVASALAWFYLLFLNGDFWRVMHRCSTWNNCGKPLSRHLSAENFAGAVPNREAVAAIVPARNEAAVIARSVASLLRQDYGRRVHVFVVDDGSSDGTADVAKNAAASHLCQSQADVRQRAGQPRELTIIPGKPLPVGWTGKLWAVQQGIEAARALRPRYYLLTDADIVHAPEGLSSLVTTAERGGYDLASCMVRLHCESVAERLLIPAFVFFFFMLYPPRWIADPKRTTAGAAGGCMLVRAEALERVGGVEAIRGEVIDDCALARVVKRTAAKAPPCFAKNGRDKGGLPRGGVWLGLCSESVSLRAYGSFVEIGRMIARTAFSQLRHSSALLAAAMLGMAITFIAPVALVLGYPTLAKTGLEWATLSVALGAAAWAMMAVAYGPMVRWYRLHPIWTLTLPLAAVFYMGATVWSAMRYAFGRGGEWKGRVQDKRR